MTSQDPFPALARLPRGTIARVRLLRRLTDARHRTCILLHGPAGSGKTTLALQWRAQMLGFGFDFAWTTVAPGDEIDTLLDGMFTGLNRVDSTIAQEAVQVYNHDSQFGSGDAIAIALLNGLARHERELVLLIDDYQNSSDARADQMMQLLLDFAPEHVHIAIVSRSVPRMSLSRLRDHGALLELGFRDLRFSFTEAEDLLRAQHADLAPYEARILYERTHGWAAGLRLLSLDLRRSLHCSSNQAPLRDAGEFAIYFRQEVLSQLSEEEFDALSRLAVAWRFNDALATALLGASEGQRLMDRLRRDDLFVLPADAGGLEDWLRFHPLFHDVLRERFDLLPSERRRATHALLGAWFGRRRLLKEAVRHCVAAGEVELAADWVERHAREMFLRGDLRGLVRAVAELPRTVVMSRVSLRLWHAWAQLCYRQLDQCHASVATLQATLPDQDADARHHLTLLEGSLVLQDDDTAAAERLLPRLEAMAPATDAILSGGRRNILGWLYLHLGQFDRAQATLAGPRLLLEDGSLLLDSAFGALTSKILSGYAHFAEGDMRAAERVLRDVLSESERALGAYSEPACNAAALLSAVLYEANDLAALRPMLEPRLNVFERVALPDALMCATLVRVRLHCIEGDVLEGLSLLDRHAEQAQGRGLERMLASVLSEKVLLLLGRHETAAAEEALAQLRYIAKQQGDTTAASRTTVEKLAAFARARWLSEVGRMEEAHAELTALLRDHQLPSVDASRRQRREAQLRAELAWLDLQMNRSDAARIGAACTLRLAHRLGLVRSIIDLDPGWLSLAESARDAGLLDSTVEFYLDYLKGQAGAPERALSSPVATEETLSDREIEIVRALASAMPNKRIAQAFGVSPETVKWHLKNIYAKLAVHSRDGAIARARARGLLSDV